MSLTQSSLRDKCCLDAETAECRRTFSRRSARLFDSGGRRVTVRRQDTPTRMSHGQTPSSGSSFVDTPSTSKSYIPAPSQSCTHTQTPPMGSTHTQTPPMGSTHIQAPPMGSTHTQTPPMCSTHIQAPPMGSTHSGIPSMSNSRTQTLSLGNSQIQTPIICSSRFQTPSINNSHHGAPSISSSHHGAPSISSSHSKKKTLSMGNSRSSTHSEVNIYMQTCTTGNPQDYNPPVDNPQYQGDGIGISGDNNPRMNNRQEHTPSPSNPQEQDPSVDTQPDQGHPADKSDAHNPPLDHRQERAPSPSNSQEQAPPVNEPLDPSPTGSDSQTLVPRGDVAHILHSQTLVPRGDVAHILHSYKSGINQLRSLRLQLVKDPTWSTIQANPNYHRSQRHSTISERMKTLKANISQVKSLEQIPRLVKKHHGSGYVEHDFKNPHFDKYTLLLDQDQKNPPLQCSRQKHGTTKRLHEKNPDRQPETLFSKELRANTGKPFTHAHSTIKYSERAFTGQVLIAGKSRKHIPDEKCFYKTDLDSSFMTYEGQYNLVKLLPRLRLTGLPDLVGDSICKTASKSVTASAGNPQQQDDGHKWGSEPEKFCSKWTNWKRWIGSTLTLRQTTSSVSGYSSVIKGGFGCRTGTFTPGDSRLHQGHDQLLDSCTDAKHVTDADSSWYRRRRDPPASHADLEEFLSPVTRVIITTTERDW